MKQNKSNLLFILVDQMRYHAMGCAGNSQVITPHLDRLAEEGACFDTAVSNIPVCTPARACILTGRYPLSHTVLTNNSLLPNDMPSIGEMLKTAGYSTGYIGKWHLAGEAFIGNTEYNEEQNGWIPPGPMRHGFDYWAVHHCTHNYENSFYFTDTPKPIPYGKWEPDGQTDLAVEYIKEHSADPFALFVSWGTPHTPFIAPQEFKDMYDPETLEFRRNVLLSEIIRNCDYRKPEHAGLGPEGILRDHLHNYYAAVTNIDHNMGRLLGQLKESGILDDTIVVFTSDHGEMMGSHGQMHKLQIWDESILVPFLIRYPGTIKPGTRVSNPFGQPDILPTLFNLMDIPVPDQIEGSDFTPAFKGEKPDAPESAFLIWPCNAVTWGKEWNTLDDAPRGFPKGFMKEYRGIRTETHTYVRDRMGDWYLYDNVNDPYQENNLIESGSPVPKHLKEELDGWLEKTDDRFEDTQYYMDRIDLETGLASWPAGNSRTRTALIR